MTHGADARLVRREVCVLFADLAGYTALTDAHGDEEAALAAIRLVELTHRSYDGRALAVKAMGDGVMLVFDDVAAGVRAGLALAHAVEAEPRFPGIRLGMDTGSVIEHDGDYFGAVVNTAARLADLAEPGQVLATDRVQRATPDLADDDQGPMRVELRHVREPVTVTSLRIGAATGNQIDPVCRMRVDTSTPGHVRGRHHGRDLLFCSEACADLFAEHPDAYAAAVELPTGESS